MKYRCIIICLLFPFVGFCQTEEEIKSMLTRQCYYCYWDMDSIQQKTIVENTWKTIYYYDYYKRKVKKGRLQKDDLSSTLAFKGDTLYYTHQEAISPTFSGIYRFFGGGEFLLTEYCTVDGYNYNYIYGRDSMGCYRIIDLLADEYLIVEQQLPIVIKKRNLIITIYDIRRILYQRQNMQEEDRIPTDIKAKQMLKEESHLVDTYFSPSSIEGVWKIIYEYEKKWFEEIAYKTTLELKGGTIHINKYDCDDYYSGEYSIDGTIFSFLQDGEKYYYKIKNVFDNEYLVMEYIWNIDKYKKKNKSQRPIYRVLFKRIE